MFYYIHCLTFSLLLQVIWSTWWRLLRKVLEILQNQPTNKHTESSHNFILSTRIFFDYLSKYAIYINIFVLWCIFPVLTFLLIYSFWSRGSWVGETDSNCSWNFSFWHKFDHVKLSTLKETALFNFFWFEKISLHQGCPQKRRVLVSFHADMFGYFLVLHDWTPVFD